MSLSTSPVDCEKLPEFLIWFCLTYKWLNSSVTGWRMLAEDTRLLGHRRDCMTHGTGNNMSMISGGGQNRQKVAVLGGSMSLGSCCFIKSSKQACSWSGERHYVILQVCCLQIWPWVMHQIKSAQTLTSLATQQESTDFCMTIECCLSQQVGALTSRGREE